MVKVDVGIETIEYIRENYSKKMNKDLMEELGLSSKVFYRLLRENKLRKRKRIDSCIKKYIKEEGMCKTSIEVADELGISLNRVKLVGYREGVTYEGVRHRECNSINSLTDKEIEYLKINYYCESKEAIMIYFKDVRWRDIVRVANSIGLVRDNRRVNYTEKNKAIIKDGWDSTKELYLIENFDKESKDELVAYIGKDWENIRNKAYEIGLSRRNGWTIEEECILRELYSYGSREYIEGKLKKHTWGSIRMKANRMGLKRLVK